MTDRAVLRVKRKRVDDPVDAFFFQYHAEPQIKKRGVRTSNTERGMFRRKETVDVPDMTQNGGPIIEAEWDSALHRMKLKRKLESDTDGLEKHMSTFSDMLSDYLKLNDVSLKSNMEPDYVYDIYYQDTVPQKRRMTQEANRASSSPPLIDKAHAPVLSRACPPSIGKASAPTVGQSNTRPSKFSPIPLSRHGYRSSSTTTAPGFEHLHTPEEDHDIDWLKNASFIPVHLRTAMDDHGQITVTAVPIGASGLTEDDLMLEEADAGVDEYDDDEDSNDEDYYGNDYPDRVDWDTGSDISSEY